MLFPELSGLPIRVEFVPRLRDRHGAVHAGAFLRQRRICFDVALKRDRREFSRIFVHELFHFVWLRLGNQKRRDYECLLTAEFRSRAQGELGWSAEWRKDALTRRDCVARTRKWREYVCESFCDTAAWILAERENHPECTLAGRFRRGRRLWFSEFILKRQLSI
jgi:hypothetical protein